MALPIRKGPEIVGYIRLARPLGEVERSIEEFTAILFSPSDHPRFVGGRGVSLFPEAHLAHPGHGGFHGKTAGEGRFRGRCRIESRDEIGQLAENINEMVDVLQKRIAA